MADGVDAKIASLADWRGTLLSHIRTLIMAADPQISEDIKWRKPTNPLGVPTWSRGGILCTGESYRDKVKLTFPHGSALPDPQKLFNASLEGKRRAIDVFEGDRVDDAALAALIRAAVAHNLGAAG
ncbi:DUF1801 domain-containing protein [Sphingomonas sp. ASY06-1R]|jgi:hypothetical protein|uniref:DUF1801 domain-containing protein n=1 Tax=Sphingomonas sp. ASY06-1R TaxID=3445771 RepID=UPI003FA2CA8F